MLARSLGGELLQDWQHPITDERLPPVSEGLRLSSCSVRRRVMVLVL